jgi:putative phage-type endonuclease
MKYPDCILIDCDQRTPEWFEARKGHLTASAFGTWLTKNDATSRKAKITATAAVLAQAAGFPDPPVFENADIKRGIEQESEALQYFQRMTGLTVDPIGFAKSKLGLFGCSPDGLILENSSGVEIKCPRASKLIQYHQAGELPSEYKDQVHGSMAVTGATSWHFLAYHRGLPAFYVEVQRDDYTESMLTGLKAFSAYLYETSERMTALAESQSALLEWSKSESELQNAQ